MKTELQQLEENTKREVALQRLKDVAAYIEELSDRCSEALRWKLRGDMLELGVLAGHFLIILVGAVIDAPTEVIMEASEWSLLLFFFTAFRSWYLHSKFRAADGEFDGCINTLRLLGYIDDIDFGSKRRKVRLAKSPFKRFKEFFERVGAKNKQEAHA